MSLNSLAKTEIKLPSFGRKRSSEPKQRSRSPRRASGRSLNVRATDPRRVVGLDIETDHIAAAEVRVNGRIGVERAVIAGITEGLVRDGEITDPEALGDALKDIFNEHGLPRIVRVGLTSQRAVMRVIDLPPLTDDADIAAAIELQAPEHIAMPIERAVLDYQVVGQVDTATGRRTRVVVAAAQREAIDQIRTAIERAGLRLEGIDLSAFALTRALYDPELGSEGRLLYAHVADVTTVAIARGTVCEMTRISPIGLDQMARRLAEREAVSTIDARKRLEHFDPASQVDELALEILDAGITSLADDLTKTLEFHASQHAGTPITAAVVTGDASLIPNFPEVLGQQMRMEVRRGAPASANEALGTVELARVALAAGLAVEEVNA